MAMITLKDIPEQLYQRLKQRAAGHCRGLDNEIIACLELALGGKQVDPEAILGRAHVLHNRISGQLTDEDLSLLKNQGRP